MERGMECTVCRKILQPTKEAKNPCTPCDSCRNLICNDCSELSSSEIKCLTLRTRLLRFVCKKCRNYELIDCLRNTIKDKEQIINDKDEIIKMLQEKVKQVEDKMVRFPQLSYSSAVCTPVVTKEKQSQPKIIIKPKEGQDSKKIKSDLDKNIDPVELKIGVVQCRLAKSGSMYITCQTREETEILEKAVKDKLKGKYTVEQTKMRKPRIKIVNFNNGMTAQEIDASIAEQNGLSGVIRTTYIRKVNKDRYIVYCECSATAFKQVMATGKLCIGWERYTVYEDLDVPRCFNCQGFYHKKQDCPNKLTCPNCSKEHEGNVCPGERLCCNNCVISNEKFNTKYNVEHAASDLTCASLEYQKLMLQGRTDYSCHNGGT